MHSSLARPTRRLSRSLTRLVAGALLAGLLGACSSAYYSTMEQFGVYKRDILVDRVEDARDAQEDAKEQFATALEQFASVVDFEGGQLQDVYNRLNREYENSVARAQAVTDRINAVERVSRDLFAEWEDELNDYSDASLRRASEDGLRRTKQRYEELLGTMRRAEALMAPVLTTFNDQVLFLRHNLNSQAVASLRNEATSITAEITDLIRAMESSIAEANSFINQLEDS